MLLSGTWRTNSRIQQLQSTRKAVLEKFEAGKLKRETAQSKIHKLTTEIEQIYKELCQ